MSTHDPRGLPRYAPLDPRRESVVIRMLARAAEQGQFHRADMRTLGNYLRADRTAQQAAHLRDMDIMAYCAQQRQEGCLPAFYAAEFGLDLGSAVSLYDIATRL